MKNEKKPSQEDLSQSVAPKEEVQTENEDVVDTPLPNLRFKRIDGRDPMKYEDVADK